MTIIARTPLFIITSIIFHFSLNGITEQDLIKFADQGKEEIEKSNKTMQTLGDELKNMHTSLDEKRSELEKYQRMTLEYEAKIESVKQVINKEMQNAEQVLRKIPNIGGIGSTNNVLFKAIFTNNEYTKIMGHVDLLFANTKALLANTIERVSQIINDIKTATNESIPHILAKGTETLKGIEEFKQKAPLLAKLAKSLK